MKEPFKRDKVSKKIYNAAWKQWCNSEIEDNVYDYVPFRVTLIKIFEKEKIEVTLDRIEAYIKCSRKINHADKKSWWFKYIE